MSPDYTFIIIGVVIFLVGLAKLSSSPGNHFNLSNIGINIGSRSDQRITGVGQGNATSRKIDWVGWAISAIGVLVALVGLFKG